MPATEHQKKEWVEAIKRDFPRLAGQEELVRMMVDVYAENPKHIQSLSSKLQRQPSCQLKDVTAPLFPDGIVPDAVQIITPENASA